MSFKSNQVVNPDQTSWVEPVCEVGNITIIGERHNSVKSVNVVKDTITSKSFECVALEYNPSYSLYGNGGLQEAYKYSIQHKGVKTFCIDVDKSVILESLSDDVSLTEFVEVANHFPVDLDLDGRVKSDVLINARERVYNEYGYNAYQTTYEYRERIMAERLSWLENYIDDGSILAVVGIFHLPYVVEKLKDVNIPEFSENEFIEMFEKHKYCTPLECI